MAKKKSKNLNCRPSFKVSMAGHLLATKGSAKAGSLLSSEGKKEKRRRKSKGCLNGPPGTFKLTEKQKRKLHPNLQKAILAYQRRRGKRIFD